MPKPILSSKARMSPAQADKLLKCYAERMPPQEAAKRAKVSANTAYKLYDRLRWRLIHVGYYPDAALSKDEEGLSFIVRQELNQRRGIQGVEVYAHAAEAIEWAEEWPPGEILRHLRKIIELTGLLDEDLDWEGEPFKVARAYVCYARLRLIELRLAAKVDQIERPSSQMLEAKNATKAAWGQYRARIRQHQRELKNTE